jgi:hypothetical protein
MTVNWKVGDEVMVLVKRAGPNHRSEIVSLPATVISVAPKTTKVATKGGSEYRAANEYVSLRGAR